MRICHGSENIIEKPVFGYGKVHNDYGQGFYCTEDIDLAKEWAVEEERKGYANVYEFDLTDLCVLNLNDKKYTVLTWIAVLLANRQFQLHTPIAVEAKRYLLENYLPDFSGVDVIRGYRADDSYFSFARDFVNNTISVEQLSEALTYGNLGEQIVLKSQRSFEKIKFLEVVESDNKIWYPKKEGRDSLARLKYYNLEKNPFSRGDTYMVDLLKEE